ncbi:Mitogen-activated protein kinase kinase kinase [Aphelenchoides bicaudatus]|nr:Mitogen-activated protein kinase kinase kinase [Aphelenchoides bicaudatus]
MEQLRVDVNMTPSSSSNGFLATSPYDQVDFREIVFPNFQNLKRLGRGSYGTVIQGVFRNKNVAIKLLDRDLDHSHIHNEAKILSSFAHTNIIKIYAAFHGEQSGLILELMEGGSLHELLHQRRHIQYFACHVVGWAQQVLDALNYLHTLQLVHRDLKPLNMLLTNDFITLKLCDFGTAAELRTSMTNNRGSAAWMAPEVFRGKKYNQACDIFSFGILLWEIVTRKQPFDDWDSHAYTILWQVSEGRRPPDIRNCPKALMDLIKSCWADNPKDRPTVDVLITVVESLLVIYPNRYLPLIDRTTRLQAFAHPINAQPPSYLQQPGQSYAPVSQTQQQTYTSTSNTFQRSQAQLPPIPPPPRIGHFRSGSHDLNNSQASSGFYSQPYSQNQTMVSQGQGQTINYSPMVHNMPSYNPPPSPSMYRPYKHSPNRPLPPTPTYMHQPNMSQSLQVPASEIQTRRSSEPPLGANEHQPKKKGRLKSLLNGIKKL